MMRPLALCYGTRPQVIKASVLRQELSRRWPLITVNTGQHYDYELNGLLYQQLGVAPPDCFLEVGSGSHAMQTSAILIGMETLLDEHRPSAVVVIGDTNSTLGCSLAACKAGVPVAHIEAGLRARDSDMPEEINRRVVDAVATLLCTPCRSATERLRRERTDASIVQTGDVAFDVLVACRDRLPQPASLLPSEAASRYVFATLHRAELTAEPALLAGVIESLGKLDLPVVLALHPRTRAALAESGESRTRIGRLSLISPVGYLESLALISGAMAVITDSGGVQREAYWLGVPCVTIREETEWVETVALGANRLTPPASAPAFLAAAVMEQIDRWKAGATWDRFEYGRGDAARQVGDAIEGWVRAG